MTVVVIRQVLLDGDEHGEDLRVLMGLFTGDTY